MDIAQIIGVIIATTVISYALYKFATMNVGIENLK